MFRQYLIGHAMMKAKEWVRPLHIYLKIILMLMQKL